MIDIGAKSAAVLAWPNPVKNNLTVNVNNYTGKIILAVYDMAGRKVQVINQVADGGTISVNTSRLTAGACIIQQQ